MSIAEIERQIAQLKKQWPAHSVPPALMERLDELEERLERAREAAAEVAQPDGHVDAK